MGPNESLQACKEFPFVVNAVRYQPDVKTGMVTVFTCVFMGLVCPCALAANALVFLGVLRKQELRNVYNTSILFLAAADLLTGLVSIPAFVVYQGSKLVKPKNDFSCLALVVYTFTTFVLTGLAVLTLTLITLERYLAIFYPFKYRDHVTKRRITVTMSTVWVIWITFIILTRFSPGASVALYSIIAAVILVPCISLTFFVYCKVYTLAKRVRGSIGHQGSAPATAREPDVRETKSFRTVAYITGTVVFCFVPTLAIAAVYQTGAVGANLFYHLMYPLSDCAAFLSAAFNPMIYVLRSSSVRNSLREMMRNRNASLNSNRMRSGTGPTATSGLEMTVY